MADLLWRSEAVAGGLACSYELYRIADGSLHLTLNEEYGANLTGLDLVALADALAPALLAKVLRRLEELETASEIDYAQRNRLVLVAAGLASIVGLEVGIGPDAAEPNWPVVYVELPTGQVSWHLPQHGRPWDGHSTEDKHQRIREFVEPA